MLLTAPLCIVFNSLFDEVKKELLTNKLAKSKLFLSYSSFVEKTEERVEVELLS